MKTSYQCAIVFAMLCLYATSATGAIGPPPAPPWEAGAQLKLGWVFDDPKNPQLTAPMAGAVLPPGATTPVWDYDSLRTLGGNPAQWYIRLPNVIDLLPVKHFALSYVYERDTTYESNRNFTDLEWEPFIGFDNFQTTEELFDAAGGPTTILDDAVLARFNVTVDMFPNPDWEDLWIGIAGDEPSPGGDGFDLLEVYIITQSIPEPATVSLIGIGALVLLVRRRSTAD